MFRDREKALQELQKQLLEEEEDQLPEEEAQEDDDLPQEVYEEYTAHAQIYNSDTTDTDLDSYSDEVYEEPRRKAGCVLWFILLTAAVLLVLAWFLAKRGGLL